MKALHVEQNDNDAEWSGRGDYWLAQPTAKKAVGRKRRTEHRPLVLCGHGIWLRIHQGTLHIRNGFTHYPQIQEEKRFFPGDPFLPSRIIIIDGDGGITFDVLRWLSDYKIPLIHIDWHGDIICAIGNKHTTDIRLVESQFIAKHNNTGFKFAVSLIEKKLLASRYTLRKTVAYSSPQHHAIALIERDLEKLQTKPPATLSELLGLEGRIANAYFRGWRLIPMQWKNNERRPIPDEWRLFNSRTSAFSQTGQFAVHPINAMLNYAYAILESQIRIELIKIGLDPRIGYLHAAQSDRASLAFDLMEPLRPIADRKILEFVRHNIFSAYDFIIDKEGICRLHSQLARYVVHLIQDMEEIEETVKWALTEITGNIAIKKPRKNAAIKYIKTVE